MAGNYLSLARERIPIPKPFSKQYISPSQCEIWYGMTEIDAMVMGDNIWRAIAEAGVAVASTVSNQKKYVAAIKRARRKRAAR